RDERHFAVSGVVDELERHLDAVAVGVVEDELALALERLGLGVELTRRGRVRDLLHADGDVHTTPVCPERPSVILARPAIPRRSDRITGRPRRYRRALCRRASMSSWLRPGRRARRPAWPPGAAASTSSSSTRRRSPVTRRAATA